MAGYQKLEFQNKPILNKNTQESITIEQQQFHIDTLSIVCFLALEEKQQKAEKL